MVKEESNKQKLKIFYIEEFFKKYTNEEHPAYAKDIKEYLAQNGIAAEEHSICKDIKLLRDEFDLDIVGGGGHNRPYYLASDDWAEEELLAMAIGIASSKYLTKSKAERLVGRISQLGNSFQGQSIPNKAFSVDRVRNENESIFTNLSQISEAIEENRKISFIYSKHFITDADRITDKGKKTVVSPLELFYNEGVYYLFVYAFDKILTYRIDRMKSVEVLAEKAEGKEQFKKEYDMKTYPKRAFNMFGDKSKNSTTVEIVLENSLLDTIIDRFANNGIRYFKEDETHFRIKADVYVSKMFFSWLCQFGEKAKLITPKETVTQFISYLKGIEEAYH